MGMQAWKAMLLDGIDIETQVLLSYKEKIEEYQANHKRQEKLHHSVLDYPALDRLMRYEAHLSRLEDRTLSQLERLQRMRVGHPVPPPLKVQISKN